MEIYKTNRETFQCECGGRRSNIPDVIRRHGETYKHTTWRFQCLCQEMLTTEDSKHKVSLLKEMRDLIRSGKVL